LVPSSSKSSAQTERLAAALRENLKRRKAKARQLAAGEAPERLAAGSAGPGDSRPEAAQPPGVALQKPL